MCSSDLTLFLAALLLLPLPPPQRLRTSSPAMSKKDAPVASGGNVSTTPASTSAAAGPVLEVSRIGPGKVLDKANCMVAFSTNEHGATVLQAGTAKLDTLSARLYPFFYHTIFAGLIPPFSTFFLAILAHYQIQPLHLHPDSILILSIFAFYCEVFLGVMPSVAFFRCFFSLHEIAGGHRAGCVESLLSCLSTSVLLLVLHY